MQFRKTSVTSLSRFRKGRGCVDQFFSLKLITEKSISHQTPLVFFLIEYEQTLDLADRRTHGTEKWHLGR